MDPPGMLIANPGIDAGDDSGAADLDVDTSCLLLCPPFQPVVLNLSCPSVVTASTSGPCGVTTCRSKLDGGACPQSQVAIDPTGAGSCHVELTFDDGYQYGVDLTLASTTTGGPCPCTRISATNSLPAVDNPSTTCADAGAPLSSDAGSDTTDSSDLESGANGAGSG
jgi:hypothetical protein